MARLGVPVSPPAQQEPVISLLRAANNPLQNGDETDGRWVNGISYQPYDNTVPAVFDPCDTSTADSPPDPPSVVSWMPYLIRVYDTCSAIGMRAHNFRERLDTAMQVGRHKAVELEFWGGAGTQAAATDNPYLVETGQATDVTPTAVPDIPGALQVLEQALSDCGLGGRGMIHMRPEALPRLTTVRREGKLLLTARDTIVVVGTGYPNTKPGGGAETAGTTWMFATGMVDVRLDEGNVNYYTLDPMGRTAGNSFSDAEISAALNRKTNLIQTRAEMFALASWDTQCWFACSATLTSS